MIVTITSMSVVNDERAKVAVCFVIGNTVARRHASGRSGRGHSDRFDNPFD